MRVMPSCGASSLLDGHAQPAARKPQKFGLVRDVVQVGEQRGRVLCGGRRDDRVVSAPKRYGLSFAHATLCIKLSGAVA